MAVAVMQLIYCICFLGDVDVLVFILADGKMLMCQKSFVICELFFLETS